VRTTRPADPAGSGARRLAAAALSSIAGQAWPAVRDRLDASTVEGRTARQLAREAEQARRAHARAVQQHAAAVARRERVVRASRRALPRWSAVAGAAAVATVPADGGASLLLATVAAGGAVRVALAVRRLARPPAVPPAPVPLQAGPPPPSARSAAFPVVLRLERARAALHQLLPMVAPAAREVAEEAWRAAAQADGALRWSAARLAAAEAYRGPDRALLAELEAGAAAQERLVDGVADLVAASADPVALWRLQDATDRVHGLAAGLREVRGVGLLR
jgi:hypothetical protein